MSQKTPKPTQPYFTRPSIEQPYYDLTQPEYRLRSFAPYPLSAWAEFSFDGLPIRVGQVVQTMQRVPGVGGVYEPLVVTPAIGLRMEPEARILPLDGWALPVRVTVHTQAAAEGTVTLNLPAGWTVSTGRGALSSGHRRRHRANSLFRHDRMALRLARINQGRRPLRRARVYNRLAEHRLPRLASL